MRALTLLLIISILFGVPSKAEANPVSFKDGWGVMPSYSSDWNDLQINYSLTNREAIGVSNYYRENEESTVNFTVTQYNYLIKRWNELDSQANVYALIGGGGRHDSRDGNSLAGYFALEGDYETRTLYTQLALESLQSPGISDSTRARYRAGFSPYKAPIDELNTWLIGQVDYMPEMEDEVTVTPLVRFFYNSFALEVGVSLKGSLFLAGMAHF